MSTRLDFYNEALFLVGERRLRNLDENQETKRLLDDVWNTNPIKRLLEDADWNFSSRSAKIWKDNAVEPEFGHTAVFNLPTDMVKLSGVYSGANMNPNNVVKDYLIEGKQLFANADILYLRYVHDDYTNLTDYSVLPETFKEYLAAHLASKIAPRLKNFSGQDRLAKQLEDAEDKALSKDSMMQPTKALPSSSWARNRSSYNNPYSGDR